MKTLIFATANQHKLKELRAILPNYTIKGLSDVGIYEDIPETGKTLEENAFIKAKYLYDRLQQTCLSEDTGLEVMALNGAPGVHTARYSGDDRDPNKNMALLIKNLALMEDRTAQFRTVIALVDGKETKYFEGIVKGVIAKKQSGKEGFGYDPVFIPEGHYLTFSELSSDIKNNISHRSRAVASLIKYLK